ncbi:MAG: ABC transporter permease [Thermoleophilia bacterium]
MSERTREIGLKKAIGAPDGAILLEYVTEAAIIGLIAGIFGLLAGLLPTYRAARLDPVKALRTQ